MVHLSLVKAYSLVFRVMQRNSVPFLLFDRSNHCFCDLHLTLDGISSEVYHKGVGAVRKSAAKIAVEHEDRFWERDLPRITTPAVLQCTVSFCVGLQLFFVVYGSIMTSAWHSLSTFLPT